MTRQPRDSSALYFTAQHAADNVSAIVKTTVSVARRLSSGGGLGHPEPREVQVQVQEGVRRVVVVLQVLVGGVVKRLGSRGSLHGLCGRNTRSEHIGRGRNGLVTLL